ncbi:hypothetical protein SAMN05216360_114169 [Methylobacterium phyllostachyos]|uniref:Uncharacterized protein n=1 Tax=Methylobacterium phyllostachyos TaxID=582672 RepID=A0A1H0GPJ2_9HYPH|nr:hypothetical protein SAMN05216360_114169 [Methylobacterium phyllostachyos]
MANIAFRNLPIDCNFQPNPACGNPTCVFKTSNLIFWPVSSWGRTPSPGSPTGSSFTPAPTR